MLKMAIDQFLIKHQLPTEYKLDIMHWFMPVASRLVKKQKAVARPLVVGINGAQGSGKSTLADLLVTLFSSHYHLNAVSLSIDDFYLTRQQREQLAETIHPLMATRGAPGTHDIKLAIQTIQKLTQTNEVTAIPRFDKVNDDRHLIESWDNVSGPVDILIIEGWCVGAQAQSASDLLATVNDLEDTEDPDAIWRNYVNQQLVDVYPVLFNLVDSWVMLKAPSFDCVYNWRLEQEQKLRASNTDRKKTMDKKELTRFIKFYQRITEHLLLTLPERADFLFDLNAERKITQLIQK